MADTTSAGTPSAFFCPHCRASLWWEADALICRNDGYRNYPVGGVYDFLGAEERAHHEEFLDEYRSIRAAEGRGSDEPAWYLALPDLPSGDPHAVEWRARADSMRWLQGYLQSPRRPLRILDAGAGNCWLTRHLAAWGHTPTALDMNDDPHDGLQAGRHYLAHGGIDFLRVRAPFERIPFVDGTFDLVIFNGSFHYAEDKQAALAEALRVTGSEGEIIIIDSPIYRMEESGWKMLAEREITGRAGFLTYAGLDALGAGCDLSVTVDPPPTTFVRRLRRKLMELRLGREVATMARVVLRRRG